MTSPQDVHRSLTEDPQKKLVDMAFATGQALNGVAFAVRKEVFFDEMPRRFMLRNKFLTKGLRAGARGPGGIGVEEASKQNLRTRIFFGEGAEYLSLHQEGGTKRSTSGQNRVGSEGGVKSLLFGQRPEHCICDAQGVEDQARNQEHVSGQGKNRPEKTKSHFVSHELPPTGPDDCGYENLTLAHTLQVTTICPNLGISRT
jgi:hypothetical protein